MSEIVANERRADDASAALVEGRHGDPFALLGRHQTAAGGWVIRALRPGARAVVAVDAVSGGVLGALDRIDPAGLFAGAVPSDAPYRLRIDYDASTIEIDDPYAFGPLLGDLDLHLLAEGRHLELGRVLGAHAMRIDGIDGVRFAVWAPNARRVSVVGDWNFWDGRIHPMRRRVEAGVWELFVPGVGPGALYKYELIGADGAALPLKADPVAWADERPPSTSSIVTDPTPHVWTDVAWMDGRAARQSATAPITIYECHAPSWLGPDTLDGTGREGWDVLADKLVPYVVRMGFTHIELLPIMEHPFGGSWGYQPLGQFAPSARMGTPDSFARFVDRCHVAGIGVILDWVPAHFPGDPYGLARFDGTALYEHADPREGFHRDWNTLIYNHGRNEVRGFLIASALHWLDHYHVDGLRVDAVASMLYRDYSRNPGEWLPNQFGGRENLEAVAFLRDLSRVVHARHPGAVLIAEESTAWPGVTQPADAGGLGFDFKWNMGWMHDTLDYIEHPPIYRRWHHDRITFGLVYAFSERFILPISHDEVVYGKGSLLGKMPGDAWQRFANLRAYLGFMWTHPGKKLLFMGSEFAQAREWNHDIGLDWWLLDHAPHAGVQHLVVAINHLYRETPALYQRDADGAGFDWVVIDDRDQSVFAYLRHGEVGTVPALVVCNFTPVPRYDYRIGVPLAGWWREVLNTDAEIYGGSNVGNGGGALAEAVGEHGLSASVALTLPPLATIVLLGPSAEPPR